MAKTIAVHLDDLFAIVLNLEISVPLRALAYYDLIVAFHFAVAASNDVVEDSLRILVPKSRAIHFRRAAATKLQEYVQSACGPPLTPSHEEDVRTGEFIFELNGGLKGLRYVPSVRFLEKKARRTAFQMRHVGRVISIQLRSKTAPDTETINPTRVLQFTNDRELRDAFKLLRGRKKTFAWRQRLQNVLPFAHLVYVTSQKKRSIGRLPRLTSKRFIEHLCRQVGDQIKMLAFIAQYNETCSQLNEQGYHCQKLASPSGFELPHAVIEHAPWPAALMPSSI